MKAKFYFLSELICNKVLKLPHSKRMNLTTKLQHMGIAIKSWYWLDTIFSLNKLTWVPMVMSPQKTIYRRMWDKYMGIVILQPAAAPTFYVEVPQHLLCTRFFPRPVENFPMKCSSYSSICLRTLQACRFWHVHFAGQIVHPFPFCYCRFGGN